MEKTCTQQFSEALACSTKEQADEWLQSEVKLYCTEYGKESYEAQKLILYNLAFMAGFSDFAVAKKINELFGGARRILGTSDPESKESTEDVFKAGQNVNAAKSQHK